MIRLFLAALLTGLALATPAQAAEKLPGALGVVQSVCETLPMDVCGPYDDIGNIGAACLVSTDEIACTLAIMKLGGSSVPGEMAKAQAYREVVEECIKQGVPIQGDCKTLLDALDLPVDKVNEVHGIVTTCDGIKDVDAALMCADYFLDTTIADDMGVKPPSYLGMLFDIYVDIRDKDYWSLVAHVGATAACAAANFILGVDVCNLLGVLADLGNALMEGLEEFGKVLDSIFGGSDCFEKNGVCVDAGIEIATWLHKWATPKVMELRLQGGTNWANARAAAYPLVAAKEPMFQHLGADHERGWVLYLLNILYPTWDNTVKGIANERSWGIKKHVKEIPQPEFEKLFEKAPVDAKSDIAKMQAGCVAKFANQTRQIQEWVAEARGNPKDVGGAPNMGCALEIALRAVTASTLNTCNAQQMLTSVNAACDNARALDVCKAAQGALGLDYVKCDFGKGGESGTAQQTLAQFAKELLGQKVMCTYPFFKGKPNEVHCEDPTYYEQCKTRMVEKYGKAPYGWPKPGIAECKLVLTEKRLKAMTDATKVAMAAPGILVPPAKPGTPTTKSFSCAVDKHDAAVVVCGIAPDATQVAKVKAALPGVAIRTCTPDESATYEKKNWINDACVSVKASGTVREIIAPIDPGKPALTRPVETRTPAKNLSTPGGSATPGPAKNPVKPSGGLGGTALDKKPAGPPGVPSNLNQPGK